MRASLFCSVILSVFAGACGDDAVKTTDTRVDAEVLFDTGTGDVPGTDTTPADTTPADTTPADTTPADTTPADSTPVDTTPADTTPADTTPADTTPADTTPADTAPEDTTVADTTPADTAPQDTAPNDTVADTTPDDGDVSADTGDVTPGCDRSGFISVAQDALAFVTGDIYYLAQSTLDAPVDVFSIEIYAALGGAQAPGTYTITDDNYDTCGNCVLAYADCDANLDNCARTFLANAGTMTVTSTGAIGDQFSATFSDLTLIEITYDDDYHSTPVTGGETWCIDSYEADATLQ